MKNVWMYEMNKQLIFCSFTEKSGKQYFYLQFKTYHCQYLQPDRLKKVYEALESK